MRRSVCTIAIATALAVVTGCGGSSSGDSSHEHTESAAGVIERLGGAVKPGPETPAPKTTPPAKSAEGASEGRALPQAHNGKTPESRSARVRKAIADLLHPGKQSQEDGEKGPSRRGSVPGILEQLRRMARERIEQVQESGKDGRRRDGGPGILDMLR